MKETKKVNDPVVKCLGCNKKLKSTKAIWTIKDGKFTSFCSECLKIVPSAINNLAA